MVSALIMHQPLPITDEEGVSNIDGEVPHWLRAGHRLHPLHVRILTSESG
jgi:hypothetical protein